MQACVCLGVCACVYVCRKKVAIIITIWKACDVKYFSLLFMRFLLIYNGPKKVDAFWLLIVAYKGEGSEWSVIEWLDQDKLERISGNTLYGLSVYKSIDKKQNVKYKKMYIKDSLQMPWNRTKLQTFLWEYSPWKDDLSDDGL